MITGHLELSSDPPKRIGPGKGSHKKAIKELKKEKDNNNKKKKDKYEKKTKRKVKKR